jgi:hypothetical protein
VERCLACEAVVHKETSLVNAVSACCALSRTYRDDARDIGNAAPPKSGSDRKFNQPDSERRQCHGQA